MIRQRDMKYIIYFLLLISSSFLRAFNSLAGNQGFSSPHRLGFFFEQSKVSPSSVTPNESKYHKTLNPSLFNSYSFFPRHLPLDPIDWHYFSVNFFSSLFHIDAHDKKRSQSKDACMEILITSTRPSNTSKMSRTQKSTSSSAAATFRYLLLSPF